MIKTYNDGFTLHLPDRIEDIDPNYVHAYVDLPKIKRHFLAGKPVPHGVGLAFDGRYYGPGACYGAPQAAPKAPKAPEAAPKAPEAAPKAPKAPAGGKAPAAPEAAPKAPERAPSLDMFDDTDPNAPRTADQNSAFWGLMEKLGKLTGKTGEEMKAVCVTRALGENKGTSKLTVAEMDKVIRFVKDTIALFEAHDWATPQKALERAAATAKGAKA